MQRHTLFRGCTRPTMFMGVPYMPFFIGTSICLALAAYINILLIGLLPPVIFVMRQIARHDEQIFHLWGLKMQFALKVRNKHLLEGLWVFSPNQYRERPPRK
ncbi:type IV secretion system protein VirB3 [Leeia oryzae]|uniref:type IV secretion system protein VirB3 n=1 Tax=Leeia oryzae TaxID=356662 RepID=UPI0005263CD9|nr:VirB3 family type IV secretion system protein [Leeia oryzae]